MSVAFQDYYSVLGVARDAKADDIRRAYLALARKHHPDMDKTPGATERFQRIAEAYEVLKDPKTRAQYDELGANWKAGQDFTPPPGYGEARRARRGARPAFTGFDGPAGFSSFFESFFGGGGGEMGAEQDSPFHSRTGADIEATLELALEDALRGGSQTIHFETGERGGSTRTIDLKIPAGTSPGTTMRLRGQGRLGPEGPGDLLLRVRIPPHPRFEVNDHDLATVLAIQPHEAALGARVSLRTLEGSEAIVSVPPGSSSGKKLRLRRLGLGKKSGERGDLIVELKVVVPESLTDAERRLYEELARVSPFDPRAGG